MGTVEGFFKAFLALFVVLFFWICGYAWKRNGWLRTANMDVDTGRREVDWDEINAYRAKMATYPMWRRVLSHLF